MRNLSTIIERSLSGEVHPTSGRPTVIEHGAFSALVAQMDDISVLLSRIYTEVALAIRAPYHEEHPH